MVLFLVRHSKVSIFLNLFVLLENPVMAMTLILGIKVLTAKLLRQGYRYKAFSKFYRRHFDLLHVSKYNVGLKTLLLQGLSEPEFMATWCINSEKNW